MLMLRASSLGGGEAIAQAKFDLEVSVGDQISDYTSPDMIFVLRAGAPEPLLLLLV